MAWDFSTDPEFQQRLDWMTEFVQTEIEPLDLAFSSHLVYERVDPVEFLLEFRLSLEVPRHRASFA